MYLVTYVPGTVRIISITSFNHHTAILGCRFCYSHFTQWRNWGHRGKNNLPMVTGLELSGEPSLEPRSVLIPEGEAPTCSPGSHQLHMSGGHSTCLDRGSGQCQKLVPHGSWTSCRQLQLPSVSNQILWFYFLLSPVQKRKEKNQRGEKKREWG